MKIALTAERLREVLHYEPLTGIFTWKQMLSNKGRVGARAGCNDRLGYINIGIDGGEYKAHRLAFLYVHGEWPIGDVDHINGMAGDNRLCNLRQVSHSANCQNIRQPRATNKTGFLGVSKSGSKFKAQIMVGGKQKNLGRYKSPQEAHQIYLSAKRSLHEACTI